MISVAKMIKELEAMGFKVNARRRTDGGMIITKINDMSFSGASGNQYARQVLGVELSQAKIEQVHFNVQKYISVGKGHKAKGKVDENLIRQLKSVQQKWRRNQVQGRITKKKLRWHLKQGGRKEAEAYLKKMSRYGSGYAYEENVRYLATYISNVALGCPSKWKDKVLKVSEHILTHIDTFKESWIHDIYSYWYEVVQSSYNEASIEKAINFTYNLVK